MTTDPETRNRERLTFLRGAVIAAALGFLAADLLRPTLAGAAEAIREAVPPSVQWASPTEVGPFLDLDGLRIAPMHWREDSLPRRD